MARRQEHLSAYQRIYLCICVTKKSQKKTGNNQWTPSENNNQYLKKNVPVGSNA